MHFDDGDYEPIDEPSTARRRPFLVTMALERAAFCMGCGACLSSPTWHAIDAAVFCRTCTEHDRENCVALLPLLDTPVWYGICIRTNGLRFLAPTDSCYCGHSIWRIYQARTAEERGDMEVAAWFLQGPKPIVGPEHVHQTPLPVAPPEIRAKLVKSPPIAPPKRALFLPLNG